MSFITDFPAILDVYRAQRGVYTHQHTVEDERCSITPLGLARTVVPAAGAGLAVMWHQQTRTATNKHWDPKWRKLRAKKVLKIDLPDYQKLKKEANMSVSEMRDKMKRSGKIPPRTYTERNIIISSTSTLFEPYVPPEGDGVASFVSKEGAKQRMTELEKKGKSRLQVRQIKKFDEDFSTKEFAQTAQDIYIEAHNLLGNIDENEDRLHELVSEKAYPEMVWMLERKTFRWKYLEALEPARVVHVRVTDMLTKENKYAQVTVRMHTKQTLAIYDRFGRLAYGSEHMARNVLDYVVFEKHLSDEYGLWRIHGKIVPDWMPPRQPVLRTLRKPDFEPVSDTPETGGTVQEHKEEPPEERQGPALATA